MWPFKTRRERHLQAELDAVKADRERIRGERTQFAEDRDAYKAAAATAARQFADADEKYVGVCIVNEHLTTDLTKAREKLAEYGARRTVPEVLEEHDVHRKALADALGEQKRHLGWDALIGEVGGLARSAVEWMGDCAKEKARADELQQRLDVADSRPTDSHWRAEARRERDRADRLQKRLDDAVGLAPGGILNSAPWQPGYQDPTPNTKASAS